MNPKKATTSLLFVAIIVAFFIAFNGQSTNVKISMIAYASMCAIGIVLLNGARGFSFALVGDNITGDVLKGALVGGAFIVLNNLNSALSLGAPASLLSLEPAFLAGALIIVAPVVEEFFFRGMVYPFIVNSLGGRYVIAAVLQGALFAIYHFAVYGGFLGFGYSTGIFFGAFVFGTTMAWLVTPRGSGDSTTLESPIVAHAIFNGYLLAQSGGLK